MPVLLDPTDERKPVTRDRTPRPGNLSGVVGLLDISKARGDVFLAHLAMSYGGSTPISRCVPTGSRRSRGRRRRISAGKSRKSAGS